jgi:hypothetical protein
LTMIFKTRRSSSLAPTDSVVHTHTPQDFHDDGLHPAGSNRTHQGSPI